MISSLLLFICIFMLFYVYLGYPAIVFLAGVLRDKKIEGDGQLPSLTLIIAAYNEEKNIGETLRNKLNLSYPKDKLEIIVISDGSTDKTDENIRKYESQGIKLFRQEPRAGKTSALNMGVKKAKGHVIVFSDANSLYEPNALRLLARNFCDKAVGYVTGKMVYTNPDGTSVGDGCTSYMKYENFLRKFETKIGSVVGVDGGIDGVRKDLYQPMRPDQLPDFVQPLKIVEQGYRVVYEPQAILQEPSLEGKRDEYKMRVRVSLRALWGLSDMRQLLTFKKCRLFAWQLWSHKLLRYLCFFFLAGAYFSNMMLLSVNDFYKLLFVFQNGFYLISFFSPILENKGFRLRLFSLMNYFLLLNLASGHAFVKFVLRRKQIVWTPRKG